MAITPLPTAPSRARPATFSAEADALLGALPTMVDEFNASMAGDSAAGLAANLAGTGSGQGGSLVGVQDTPNWFAAVVTKTVESVLGWLGGWLWGRDVNVFQYLTTTEIASVKAYNYAVDVTTNVQAAIDAAFSANRGIFFPAGGYYCSSGLKHPGRVIVGVQDDRGRHLHMYGAGTGEAFVISNLAGTVIKAGTVSAFSDYADTAVSSNGSMELHHIRFVTTSTSPVVYLQSMLGMQHVHDCVFYQLGTGDGIKATLGPTCSVERCYSMNSNWATGVGLGASRTGIGYNFPVDHDGGLLNLRKNTSRGWLTGYSITNGGGVPISYKIESCECSLTYNGIKLTGTNKAIVSGCYMEGGDGGTGIDVDGGSYASICDNLIYPGYSTAIKDTSTSNKGTCIQGNIISLGAVTPAIGIDIASSAAFGGYNKVVDANAIAYTLGTANVNGIKISGTDPRIQVTGNAFDARGNWTGSGTLKINDTSSNGVYGIVQTQTVDREFLNLSRVAVHWQASSTVLSESNVSGNTLTLPDGCSYYTMAPNTPVSINTIVGNVNPARELIIRTTNTNTTFTDSALVVLAGGTSFTGVGILRGILDRSGANNMFYEMSRSSL